jgi:hypothetical protein
MVVDSMDPNVTDKKIDFSVFFEASYVLVIKSWLIPLPLGLFKVISVSESVGFDLWELSLKKGAWLTSLSAKICLERKHDGRSSCNHLGP